MQHFPALPNAQSGATFFYHPPTRGPYFPKSRTSPFPIRNFPVKEKLCLFRTPKQQALTAP